MHFRISTWLAWLDPGATTEVTVGLPERSLHKIPSMAISDS